MWWLISHMVVSYMKMFQFHTSTSYMKFPYVNISYMEISYVKTFQFHIYISWNFHIWNVMWNFRKGGGRSSNSFCWQNIILLSLLRLPVVAESRFRLCSVLLFFVNVVNLIGQGWPRTPRLGPHWPDRLCELEACSLSSSILLPVLSVVMWLG